MNQTSVATEDKFTFPSLRKQQLYRRYANGELNWHQVAEAIGKIHPPPPHLSRKRRAAIFVSTILLALLTPPWARRDD